jgi:hypothetical protein
MQEIQDFILPVTWMENGFETVFLLDVARERKGLIEIKGKYSHSMNFDSEQAHFRPHTTSIPIHPGRALAGSF